ncbi:MAG: hypothetical protein JNN15_10740 [Blastocatellia bacterium]|nr:hypothetical protein [Blastocatellia bacterium]
MKRLSALLLVLLFPILTPAQCVGCARSTQGPYFTCVSGSLASECNTDSNGTFCLLVGVCKKDEAPPQGDLESINTDGLAYSDEFLRQVANVDTRFAATLWVIRKYPKDPIMVKWFDVPILYEDFELLLSGQHENSKIFHLNLQKKMTDSTAILDYKIRKSVDKQAGKIFLTIEAPVSEKGHTTLDLTLDTKVNKNRTQDVLSWNIR